MTATIRSQQDLYQIYKQAVLDNASGLLTDFSDGSINDALAGATSLVAGEAIKVIIDGFKKTLFGSATGPDPVLGGPDDLSNLAIDHFGAAFGRPAATSAVGVVTFSRPTSTAGTVTIPFGTVVKTTIDANGNTQRFSTLADVIMTTLTVNASVTAMQSGTGGNVVAGAVNTVESTLTDTTITVSNSAAFSGGAPVQDDPTYRQTIYSLIQTLKGATLPAIQAAALTVPGVATATPIEIAQTVINYNVGSGTTSGAYYTIPYPALYIADINGAASAALISLVNTAVNNVRAGGVQVNVLAAVATVLNWNASISLNPAGPNFTALQLSTAMILQSMTSYLQKLPIGTSFLRATAQAYIMSVWGPSGTNDLTAFTINNPTGDVTVPANGKLTPGSITIS